MLRAREYLPIGSIVLLKGAIKKIMIIGILQSSRGNDKKIKQYDYIGVMFPHGFLNTQTMFMFNHDQINDIVFRGYENPERKEFLEKLEDNIALAEKLIAEQKASEEQGVNAAEKQIANKDDIIKKSNQASSDDIF